MSRTHSELGPFTVDRILAALLAHDGQTQGELAKSLGVVRKSLWVPLVKLEANHEILRDVEQRWWIATEERTTQARLAVLLYHTQQPKPLVLDWSKP